MEATYIRVYIVTKFELPRVYIAVLGVKIKVATKRKISDINLKRGEGRYMNYFIKIS